MDIERELLKGNTPTLVLAILQEGPKHGYGIAREIKRLTGEALQFKQGTLYPALHALERDGLIWGKWEIGSGDRPRRVYAITEAGRTELELRKKTWTRFSFAMNAVIAGSAR
ncbi:MAG TPA: helix-turn-helix transcriptional regulator [Capsulimonadaceae bacterium]|nr:helix-turn-helix transcriptional regulator [Capsulimonadaceae bacterium]